MERTAWTDERLDDLSNRVDAGFARVDSELRGLRSEMRDVRREVHDEMSGLRTELTARFDALQNTIVRVGGGMMVGLIGVIAAVLVRGG
jgi:hypothetical protein